MKCPYCGSEEENGRFCENCGAELKSAESRAASPEAMKLVSNTGAALGKKARELRVIQEVGEDELIPVRSYNLIMMGTVLWGVLVNVIMCGTLGARALNINPVVLYVGYFILCFLGIRLTVGSSDPKISFLGYNLVVIPFGFIISVTVRYFLQTDPSIVTYAFFYTALICAGMTGAVMAFPEFFEKLGGMLTGCLIGLVFCEIILLIFRVDQSITDWICAAIFSLYIGFDIYRAQKFPKTVDNAVDSALDIYMDIANLFIRLLSILARSKRDD